MDFQFDQTTGRGMNLSPRRLIPSVLLVDDEVSTVKVLNQVLAELGCQNTVAFDGVQMIDLIQKDHFDLVILDWLMPEITGVDSLIVLEQLISQKVGQKVSPKFKKIPFIIHTGLNPEKIVVPELRFFKLLEFWKKPMSLPEITRATALALKAQQKKAG